MPLTNITPLPALSRTDPLFKQQVDTFFGSQLPTFTVDINSLASEVQDLADSASSSASSASDYAQASLNYAQQSSNSKDLSAYYANQSASSANVKGLWSELSGPMSPPSSVIYDGKLWILVRQISDVSSSVPGVSNDWILSPSVSGGKLLFYGSM